MVDSLEVVCINGGNQICPYFMERTPKAIFSLGGDNGS